MKLNFSFGKGGDKSKSTSAKDKDKGKGKPAAKKKGTAPAKPSRLKPWLAENVEKVGLGLAVAVLLALLYLGIQARSEIANAKSPSDLAALVQEANTYITSTTTDAYEQRNQDPRLTTRAKAALKDVDVAQYPLSVTWRPPFFPTPQKRIDPELLAAKQLEVHSLVGAVADDPVATGGAFRPRADRPSRPRPATVGDPEKFRIMPTEDQAELIGNPPGSGSSSKAQYLMVVNGLVPIKDQIGKYVAGLAGASEYTPDRDQPRYVGYEIERVEVLPDGKERNPKTFRRARQDKAGPGAFGGGAPEEEADANYVGFAPALVDPLPRLLMREVSSWAIHSQVPRRRLSAGMADDMGPPDAKPDGGGDNGGKSDKDQANSGDEANASEEEGDLDAPAVAPGFGARGGEIFGGGAGRPRGRRGDEDFGGAGGFGNDFGGGPSPNAEPPEFAMLRFVDQGVTPWVSYRYRVRLILEDVNDPLPDNSQPPPSPNSYTNEVAARLASKPPLEKRKKSDYCRLTEWSEWSAVATVRPGVEIFAGRVTMPTTARDEPMAKAMVVQWDPERARDIAVEFDLRRGTVGNFVKKDLWAYEPEQNGLEKLDEARFNTNLVVVDIAGGETLPQAGAKSDEEKLVAPGELLILDELGNLRVQRELTDERLYRHHHFHPPEKTLDSPGAGFGFGGGAFGEGGGGKNKLKPGEKSGRAPGGIFGGQR